MTVSMSAFFAFGLALTRVSGLVVMAPLFYGTVASAKVKIGFVVILAIMLTSVRPPKEIDFANFSALATALAAEFAIGLLLAAGFRLAEASVTIAGELAGLQMGVGAASIYDANAGVSSTVMPHFFSVAFTMLFLTFDGHHHLLRALSESFITLPAGSAIRFPAPELLISQCMNAICFGFRVAAPIVVPLLIKTASIAMASRVFPQANVLSLSYGASMLVGFILLAASMPEFGSAVWHSIRDADVFTSNMMHALSGA